ncbi:MAG: tRNA isopentenyl-2-thiomethyl-A-37 hydroxylase MiaE, partial [Isosphaeraceae bacterium]
MNQATNASDLPLLSRTPDSWAGAVIKDLLALLNDHAYLEKKAASNALELLNRWPEPDCPPDWVSTLAAIASDETAHLSLVVRLLNRRGGRLERTHRNPYANALRALVRKGRGNEELVDRLLISALIEAR